AHPEYINKFGNTALILASQRGATEIVKLLLATKEAHPEHQNTASKTTALMKAAQKGYSEIVELLLKTGNAHPEYQNIDGLTVLMLEAQEVNHDTPQVVKLLLDSGQSNYQAKDVEGETAFDFALETNDPPTIQVFQAFFREKAMKEHIHAYLHPTKKFP